MTLVYGNAPILRGKPEDSSAMQRRLMQDLERQWLDDWGQAAQVQAIQEPPAGEDSQTAADASRANSPPSTNDAVGQARGATPQALPAATAAAPGATDTPSDARTGAPVLGLASAWTDMEARLPNGAGTGRDPAPASSPPNAKPAAVAFSALPADLPSAAGRDEAITSDRGSYSPPSGNPDLSPNPRHLMMREVSADEVLASMRDAQLGTAESQLAAQELSRALMQAGYARVQVVVNGHRQRHGIEASGNTASGAELPVDPPLSTPTNSQRACHGN